MAFQVFLALALLSGVVGQNYVANITFRFREEKFPEILYNLIDSDLSNTSITTGDLIDLSKLDRLDLNETLALLESLNITPNVAFSVDNLERVLTGFQVGFKPFYNRFLNISGIPVQVFFDACSALGILQTALLIELTKDPVDNSEIYELLRNGTFNETTVNASLAITGKSADQVFDAARSTFLEEALKLNSTAFVGILRKNGWSYRAFLQLYEALNLTTRDVYDIPNFRELFENVTDRLNRKVLIGVFVGPNKLAVHREVYRQVAASVEGQTIKAEVLGEEIDVRNRSLIGDNILQLTTKSNVSEYIEIAKSYNSSGYCDYIFSSDAVTAEAGSNVKNLEVNKTASQQFQLGSPLVCNNVLYGLAHNETNTTIIFTGFYTDQDPVPVTDQDPVPVTDPPEISTQAVSGVASFTCVILNLAFSVVILLAVT